MPRSFRFIPPEPRADLLTRPRLLRSLVGRWSHRVTSLTGGPGLGKTTLLAQAIAENRLAPRGEDLWIGLDAYDADSDRLSRVIAAALATDGGSPGEVAPTDPTAIADEVWRRAPTEACIVLDDVHLVPAGSTGAAWLSELVKALPDNGHLVLASRSEPPVPLTRFGSQGAVLRLAEDDLRFSDDELTGFARQRGVEPSVFEATGGWPAMAELAATVQPRFTGAYLWEEVLEPLGTMRRHILAVLCDLGGADDELLSAAVGTSVDLAEALDGVPLISRSASGWYRPHGLWRSAPRLELTGSERTEVRRRAAAHLNARGQFDEAFTLLQEAEIWDAAPATLRSACLASDRIGAGELQRWLSSSSEGVRASTAGALAAGLHAAFVTPEEAIEPLEHAQARCRADGDVDGELVAIAQLGRLAWWRQDVAALGQLMLRIVELEATGNSTARALATVSRAMLADVQGDAEAVLAELSDLDPSLLDPAWEVLAAWLYGTAHVELGQPELTYEVVERLLPGADRGLRVILLTLQQIAQWSEGRVDEVFEQLPKLITECRQTGNAYLLAYGQGIAGAINAHVGQLAAARRAFDEAKRCFPPGVGGQEPIVGPLSRGLAAFSEGYEEAATKILVEAMEHYGLDSGMDRRIWRQALPNSYVMSAEARAYWDNVPLKGLLATERELAAAVVDLRAGNTTLVRDVELPSIGLVRAALHFRLAAELAVGLAEVGRPEGPELLDALGTPGRDALRTLAAGSGPLVRRAKTLLAAVPAPPPQTSYLAMLGPLELRRGGAHGAPVVDADLRRKRVQAVLAYLVGHRRTTRAALAAALWPELDERAAGNNLGVTLNHVLRVLEPWRDSGEPSFLLRVEGASVQLVTGDHLRIDVDEFDRHLAAAAQAEADGTPSLALEHALAAVALYRDQLCCDVPDADADWLMLDREHYRTRFVSAAVRAGQLLLARGDVEQASAVAHRVLGVDPWCEEAYAVLVGSALARGDRTTARRLLAHCIEALTDLGVTPSDATRQLERRI